MFRLLADLVLNRAAAIAIVVGTLVLAAVSLVLSGDVKQDDDVLAFLPEGNQEIQTFQAVNERFGGLDVALVGIEVDDPFDAAFLTKLTKLSQDIRESGGVDRVLSLTTVDDFTEAPEGGIITSTLVDAIPANDAEEAALREKVMSRDHVVGVMISEDARAVLLYVFGSPGTEPRELADNTRRLVDEAFPDLEKYWGGAPFISTYIYRTTEADLARLTPWAVLALVAIIVGSFRDWIGSALALFTTGLGILVTRAAMVFFDVPFNIVLSSMPVMLFALGSAFSVHMLSRYYANRGTDGDSEQALRRTMIETAPVVVATGLTTVTGNASFVFMDIAPMRTFGVFTALGIFVSLVLSVTFIPAVVRLMPLRGWVEGTGPVGAGMVRLTDYAGTDRTKLAVVLFLVSAVGAFYVGRVDNRMDQSTFFSEGSPPDRAQKFLDQHFGGSQFLQIEITGDFGRPEVLREVRQLAGEIAVLPHVTQVQQVADVIATVNHAMDGVQRVPDRANQVGALYGFLAGNAAVRQLVTDERGHALMHVKIGSNQADVLEDVLARVEALVATRPTSWEPAPHEAAGAAERLTDQVAIEIAALSHLYGAGDLDRAAVEAALAAPAPPVPQDAIRPELVRFLSSDECFVTLTPEQAAAVADATLALGPLPEAAAWSAALLPVLEVHAADVPAEERAVMAEDLVVAAEGVLEDLQLRESAARHADAVLAALQVQVPDGGRGERFRRRVASTLLDLAAPTTLSPSTGAEAKPLTWTVTGLPVMYAGLSRSVTRNQFSSLFGAILSVVVIQAVLFRSVSAGLLATVPTLVTLLVVYGVMGFRGVHLDIGTSMLGSLIVGAGVDFAVHLMSAWTGPNQDSARRHAVLHTAPAIWTSAAMVAAGFFILTLGDARPLQNVGGLTAAAMLVAAAATFLAVPVLARRHDYGDPFEGGHREPDSR